MTAPTKASTVTEVVEVGDGRSGGGQGAKPPKGGGEQRGPSPGVRQPEEHAPPSARPWPQQRRCRTGVLLQNKITDLMRWHADWAGRKLGGRGRWHFGTGSSIRT